MWCTLVTGPLVQAYRGMFYMGKFNGPSPKRHILWCNDEEAINLVLAVAGSMTKAEMKECKGEPLVRKTTTKQGVKRYSGNKDALRASQSLTRIQHFVQCFKLVEVP